MGNMLNVAATAVNISFVVLFLLFVLINAWRGFSKGIICTALRTVFIFI